MLWASLRLAHRQKSQPEVNLKVIPCIPQTLVTFIAFIELTPHTQTLGDGRTALWCVRRKTSLVTNSHRARELKTQARTSGQRKLIGRQLDRIVLS